MKDTENGGEAFIWPDELAARWEVSRRTLDNWRSQGTGPAYVKIGGRVRYRVRAVEAYERAQTRLEASA